MENTEEVYMTDIFDDESVFDLEVDFTAENEILEALDYEEGINELVSQYA